MNRIDIRIEQFTLDRVSDVLDFEKRLREEENVWGWEIDDAYTAAVQASFLDHRFRHSLSLIAYVKDRVAGRIDTVLIPSHFDGSVKAYLDWICVLKSHRHQGIAQALLAEACKRLKDEGANTLIALTASNEEAQRFYRSIPNSLMRDTGIWIDL